MADDLVSTDEAILTSIGEGDESATDASPDPQDTGTTTDAPEASPPAGSEQDTSGSDGQEQVGRPGGPQDLVDAAGNIVAAGGKERRFYETAQRERNRADQATRELETAKAQLEAVNSAGNVGTQYNLTPDEVTVGAKIVSAWKENPVQTIQYLLTQAQSDGHNVDAVLSGGGTDMNAIKQMFQTALAPLVSERQERIDTQETQNRAQGIYNNFVAKYPDAPLHENSLARLLKHDSSLSPEAAYLKLQNYYLTNGLDWKKPLERLQQEAQAAQGATPNTSPQPPNGGGIGPNDVTDTARVADVNTSFDDIIRDSMKEAGIN